MEEGSPNPIVSDRAATIRCVPLDRPPRPPAGAVNDAVRDAILRRASEDLGLQEPKLLALHTEAEYVRDTRALFEDIERRYQLARGALEARVLKRIVTAVGLTGVLTGSREPVGRTIYSDRGAGFVLLEIPEAEFLTVIENAVALGREKRIFGGSNELDFSATDWSYELAERFVRYADEALRAHGAPYRRVPDEWRFEWVGDPAQHELTVQPALLVLADTRLAGPRAEFEEALRKRRLGTPKDLEDAVDEAAKAVESILKVLHDERGVARPSNEVVSRLFQSLKDAQVLPRYVSDLVTAVAGPRNNMAGHGQGATVREVPDELADASIAAAATAVTFLAHYLP